MAAKLNKITIYITSTEVFFNRDADGNSVFDEKLYKKAYNIVTEGRRSKADKLRFNEESSLFAVERNKGLESIIGNIYQSFGRTRYL